MPGDFQPRFAAIGERFEKTLTLDAEAITRFAQMAGDSNPLHHDVERAKQSRFGGLIASGPQTSALLMGLSADVFCARGMAVGLEFNFKFRRAVPAGEAVRLQWTVVNVQPTHPGALTQGELVALKGSITSQEEALLVSASGLVLVSAAL